jgi:glutaredoxin
MPLAWLSSWWRRRPRKSPADLQIVLYTRRGCHLCDDAWDLLSRFQQRYSFRLQSVDIDADPALAAMHGNWVPVVTVNGKIRFRGRVNEVLLRRLLDVEAKT